MAAPPPSRSPGENARVVVSGRRADEGRKHGSLGVQAEFIEADVRFEDDVRKLADQTLARYGGLDVAANAAGTEGESAPLTKQTPERYAAVFDANVLGTLLAMKHELRAMAAQGSSIVNISSTMGARGAAAASLHAASKHAVEGLMKSAALEASAFGVRVNATAPGPGGIVMLDRVNGGRTAA